MTSLLRDTDLLSDGSLYVIRLSTNLRIYTSTAYFYVRINTFTFLEYYDYLLLIL